MVLRTGLDTVAAPRCAATAGGLRGGQKVAAQHPDTVDEIAAFRLLITVDVIAAFHHPLGELLQQRLRIL